MLLLVIARKAQVELITIMRALLYWSLHNTRINVVNYTCAFSAMTCKYICDKGPLMFMVQTLKLCADCKVHTAKKGWDCFLNMVSDFDYDHFWLKKPHDYTKAIQYSWILFSEMYKKQVMRASWLVAWGASFCVHYWCFLL